MTGRGSPNGTAGRKRAMVAAYAETGIVRSACEAASVPPRTHANWLRDDPVYAASMREAGDLAADRLEREALCRAVEGVKEPVFYQGRVCGSVTRYSDTLLIFTLKGLRPEKYRDNVRFHDEVIHHNGHTDLDREIAALLESNGSRGRKPGSDGISKHERSS